MNVVAARARADRRVPPLLVGTLIFLASELTFFGGLFAAYFFLRASAATWPPSGVRLDAVEPAVATALLLLSSGTMQLAVRWLGRGDVRAMSRWVAASWVLGAVFVASQFRTYATATFEMSSHAYGSLFYTMTGFHTAHVLVGLALMLMILWRAAAGTYGGGRVEGVEAITYYWHFVDAVWVALFSTIYLIR